MLQSGIAFDSCTIQLLILSLRRRSTARSEIKMSDPNMWAGVWDEHSDPGLTFIVLGSPFLISWTPRSFLLSRTVQETNNNNNNNDELVWKARFLDCLVDYNRALITQCTAESGVRLSFGWSLSTLPAVTSSHKAALSHRSLPSDGDAADRGNVTKTYKY